MTRHSKLELVAPTRLVGAAALLLTLVLLLPALPQLEAQEKATIQRRSQGGGSSGRSSGIESGSRAGLRSSGQPSKGSRQTTIGGDVGRRPTAPTLAPGFRLRGREEIGQSVPRSPRSLTGSSASSGDARYRRYLPARGRDALNRRAELARDHGKAYLRPHGRRSDERWDRSWRRHRRFRDDDVTFIVLDPYGHRFHYPYGRYPFYDRHRYRYGLGCGFYDRYFPGFYGGSAYSPCFSTFSLYLGWPWLVDPWPGFWSFGSFYDYGSGYANGRAYGSASDAGYRSRAGGVQAYTDLEGEPYDGEAYEEDASAASGAYAEGRRLMQAGEYVRALAAFDEYAVLVPGDPVAQFGRGFALVALGHYGKAAEAFRNGVDAFRPSERVLVDAPAFFRSRAEFRRVTRDLEEYMRLHADSRDARFDLAVLYLMSGERADARSLLRSLRGEPQAATLLEDLEGAQRLD